MDSNENSLNALILLFVFDKMDIPMTEYTIIEMVSSLNNWIYYMPCKEALNTLIKNNWIQKVNGPSGSNMSTQETYYALTVDGRMCLSHLFYTIPASIRVAIVDFITEKRMHFRRKQEYLCDYYPNEDGTYTVILKIMDSVRTIVELNLCVADRTVANTIYRKWEEKAADVYALLHENLID